MAAADKTVVSINSDFKAFSWISTRFQVSNSTLKSWADRGLVPVLRLPSGKRLYSVPHLVALLGHDSPSKERIIYARVSSEKQRPD